ncbi:hypothetical protein OEZ85_002943 [Tetradesmus obliquus]|uniref:DUF3598 domain-containing protein n=1 Tax=Tetradesmus obliquus TaxID=3088 RepID=A0ABY8U1S1_TETOB|nr:hypothetical protein OEZ85_002943 [Tetradesmus obliquus]
MIGSLQSAKTVRSSIAQRQCVRQHSGCLRRRLQLRTRPAAAQEAVSSPALADEQEAWKSFAANVSGEWEGITATFTPAGEPEQLPEHYVPGAFRDWGVELWDWQSQCSSTTAAAADGRLKLRSMVRRLMPTVGCEADAIAFTEEVSGSSSSSSSSADGAAAADAGVLLVARADGSYSTGPATWPAADERRFTQLQLEHCFVLPQQAQAGPEQQQQQQQQRFRVKVVQNFKRAWGPAGGWRLTGIDLHKEKYDGPFTGKRAWSAVQLTAEGRLLHAEAGVMLEGAAERVVSVRRFSGEGETGELAAVGLMPQSKQ